jgi:hypothetical protein
VPKTTATFSRTGISGGSDSRMASLAHERCEDGAIRGGEGLRARAQAGEQRGARGNDVLAEIQQLEGDALLRARARLCREEERRRGDAVLAGGTGAVARTVEAAIAHDVLAGLEDVGGADPPAEETGLIGRLHEMNEDLPDPQVERVVRDAAGEIPEQRLVLGPTRKRARGGGELTEGPRAELGQLLARRPGQPLREPRRGDVPEGGQLEAEGADERAVDPRPARGDEEEPPPREERATNRGRGRHDELRGHQAREGEKGEGIARAS